MSEMYIIIYFISKRHFHEQNARKVQGFSFSNATKVFSLRYTQNVRSVTR